MIFTKNIVFCILLSVLSRAIASESDVLYDKLLIFPQGIYAKHGKRARTVVQTALYILNM